MDDHPHRSVVVPLFSFYFVRPDAERQTSSVLDLHHHTFTVYCADATDVAAVLVPRLDSPVYPVVVETLGHVIRDSPLSP